MVLILASMQKSWLCNGADANVKCIATLKNSIIVSQRTKHTVIIHSPTISLLAVYPREINADICTKTHTQISALFVIITQN